MKKYYLNCSLSGESFDPYKLEKNISTFFKYKVRKGDVSELRGIPFSTGDASFDIEVSDGNLDNAFSDFFRAIDEILGKDENGDISKIDVCLSVYYTAQCNLGFDAHTLEKFGKRNITFLVDCYKVEEEDLQPTEAK